MTGNATLLSVVGMNVALPTPTGPGFAVRDLSFELERGQTLGIVGESGCGKSMTALALMSLLPEGAITSGRIELSGQELLSLDEDRLCTIRGNNIAMIFQEPMTSLNPLHPVGRQVMEPLLLHRGLGPAEARSEAIRLLEAERRLAAYPHQLSGGQRQRVMIAMALSCQPDVLIADEPTTALDVTIQGQILDLIAEIVSETGMALILISHDLGVIAESVDRVMVMYGGAVVERGATEDLFGGLAHPYSQGLFAALPKLGAGRQRLETIPGTVPELADLPAGCTFADRCSLAEGDCRDKVPLLEQVDAGHEAACFRLNESAPEAPS